MRPAALLCLALLGTILGIEAACGGSSSETPWPVEPSAGGLASPPEPGPATENEDAGARRRKD